MLRWRFRADSDALRTEVGEKLPGRIRVEAPRGCALHGPRLELPAGRAVARICFAGPRRGIAKMDVALNAGSRTLAEAELDLARQSADKAEISFEVPSGVQGLEVRLFCKSGVHAEIAGIEIDLERLTQDTSLDPGRPVGYESSKTYADKIASGFFERYLSGPNIMEVGYKGYDGATVPIVPQAIGIDVGYAGYDGFSFPFADGSFDAIYSSHCFEHIGPWKAVLQDWYRLLKVGGYLVVVVPHQYLFERKRYLPSFFNGDHKRYYTSASLLLELQEAFAENSYRIRHLVENDKDFDYTPPPGEGSSGCYEIELVVEKIRKPYWSLDDGSVRSYGANEFRTPLLCEDPWSLPLDCRTPDRCLVWGPYINLPAASFIAEFYFDRVSVQGDDIPALTFDVAKLASPLAIKELDPEATRNALAEGKVTLPFANDEDGANFEFRIYVSGTTSEMRPIFKGLKLSYEKPSD
jgi:hypothetical protein